ncbi:MAG: glycosyltransferase [Ginsengibacter sp.]
MSTKRIVIIGPAHPLRGGLASYDERLAKEFIDNGHDTTIYSFSLQYPSFLFPGTTQYSSEPAPKNILIKVIINSINPLNWLRVGNNLRKLQPDIIVVRYWLPFMGPCLGTILRIVKKNKVTRIVCIADNVIPHEKRFGDKSFTTYFLKPVDAFITMSEKVLNDIKHFVLEKPVKYIPHPLYDNFGEPIFKTEARQYLQIDETKKVVLFFGFIRKYKGLDILLRALKILSDKTQDIYVLVAGEFYEDKAFYENLIVELGISNNLILRTNFISDSEVKYYLCAADVVIQPYRNATQSGVTPLAYHFEKPMIVTNVGSLPLMVSHGKVGLITEPEPVALANTITEFYNIGESHFIPFIKAEKQKYSWQHMASAILNI